MEYSRQDVNILRPQIKPFLFEERFSASYILSRTLGWKEAEKGIATPRRLIDKLD